MAPHFGLRRTGCGEGTRAAFSTRPPIAVVPASPPGRCSRLLDEPEDGQRIAIMLGREVGDGERLRWPRHQFLDRSSLADEGRPEGEIVTVRAVVVVCVVPFFRPSVGVVEADEIRPVSL